MQAARELGHALAARNLGLVYGGAKVGVMGALAQAVLERGGKVIGVIPRMLMTTEVANLELADLRLVASMHERKALMAELADGFIALPGGFGTLDELFEAVTWAQLGLHHKPCGLLNVHRYYDRLLDFLHHISAEHFIKAEHHDMVLVDDDCEALLEKFVRYKPRYVGKWR